MEPVGDSRSYCIMVCRACQQAWFHQACIQEQAMHAGIYCFQCPVCRDWTRFIPDMLILGIRIPFRPIRDDSNAYAALPEKERSCDTIDCPYPRGREQAEREGPWELLLCCSCAAQSTHRRCSYVSQSRKTWDCNACAGEGTASSTLSYLASLSTISQQGPGPSQCSATPESSSSNTFSQAPSGPANCSSVPESSIPSSQSRTGDFADPEALPCSWLQPRAQARTARPDKKQLSVAAPGHGFPTPVPKTPWDQP
ncbi:PHD finger protein 7-like isoform X1 [Gallus gallus]|uniref:PHD finger protein 7-like isoform X1 n=1 Tax=Gallus gallus TaxID=9031 RepID=UPI001AEB39CC|nr:PHD finger protein 7-like isoform X1 [Gallus gallus]